MLNQATMDMLTAMKMTAMAAEFANQLKDPTFNELGFEERLGLLVNAEWNRRQSNREVTADAEPGNDGYAHGNEDDRYGSGVRQPVERPHVQ